MEEKDDTEQLLRSAALQTASSILLLRQRAEQELIRAKQSLELKTEELAKSLSMMQATLDSTTDGILATDDAGRVTTFNEKFVQMWQIPSTAIDSGDERQLWRTLLPNLSDPNRYLARLEEIYTTSPEETFDLVEFADGRVFERYSKLQTIENRGVGRVWSFRDVTERLGRERALEEIYQAEQRARADAEHANLAKDHFLAALSHELRTPLTPVLALLYGLKENSELPRSVAEDIETIRRNVALEARLIDDLLDLTRITRGKAELHCESVRIGQVIEDAIQTCLAEITQKNLQLVQKIERPQQIIRADAARLTQILWNLLKNAVKFTPPGGVITILSYVANEDDRARVIIEVSDSGLGIEPEQLGVIFDAFEQGDRKITRQFGGLGLGLAISKAIADLHQATLTATSRGLHRGATFTLSLPFSPSDPIAGTEPRPVSPEPHHQTNIAGNEPGPRRTARILLVEDHVDTAKALERLLRRMGHEVVSANSIASALRVAEEEPNRGKLDLLISDLGLPDGSGLALMKSLSSTYGLPGIALSGYGMEQDLSESFAAGFSRHLTKPVDIGEVQAAIDNLVAQR